MYCILCHYDLRGLDLEQCPECGRPFNQNDPKSYDARLPGPAWRHAVGLLVIITLSLGVVIALLMFIVWYALGGGSMFLGS